MASVQMTYLANGEFLEALEWAFKTYMPYGIMWMLFAVLIFAVVQTKTISFGISSIVLILYSVVTSSMLPVEFRPFIYLFIGILGFSVFYYVFNVRRTA